MNFSIVESEFAFLLEVDEQGRLTSFTATKGETTYDCKIQVTFSSHTREYRVLQPVWLYTGQLLALSPGKEFALDRSRQIARSPKFRQPVFPKPITKRRMSNEFYDSW